VLTRKLQAFADSRGYVMLDQFTAADIDVFYSTSKLGIRSKAKMLESIRRLFRFFVNREFIAKSPVSTDPKPPIGGNRMTNKMPFTDEQLADIIKACDQINGGEVFTYVPDWLRDRLQALAQRCGKQPFMTSRSQRLDGMTDIWRQTLAKVFELADIGTERATPHRFRHTFARILLEKGVPVAAVADLMGDTEQLVRQHYSRWCGERQAALTKILKDAFSDKPKLTVLQSHRA
jgi:site-specific recombinase XerD